MLSSQKRNSKKLTIEEIIKQQNRGLFLAFLFAAISLVLACISITMLFTKQPEPTTSADVANWEQVDTIADKRNNLTLEQE